MKFKGTNIFFREDLPPALEQERREILPVYNAARQSKVKAVLKGNIVVVRGKTYGVKDIHRLPNEISQKNEFEKSTEDKVAFSGIHSPCSNFHPANVQVNGRTFRLSEQYFQFRKAVFANDHQAQGRILAGKCWPLSNTTAILLDTYFTLAFLLSGF